MLREAFPETQFILTTHDPIWLKHMKTIGLIAQDGSVQFGRWDVDNGPTEWDNRDVWNEIEGSLVKNDVRSAAGSLRHYLEYAATEICHCLRASVEFRADSQFQLGDLLPRATKQYSDLLKEGERSSSSWGRSDEAKAIAARRAKFDAAVRRCQSDQWQINPSIHYNEWINLEKKDFVPVAAAFRDLLDQLFCPNCKSAFYVSPERGQRNSLRCTCESGISLLPKKG